MTAAQQEALRRAAAATEPVPIPAVTARILAERYGYIERHEDGWRLTHRGRAHLAGERAHAKHRAVEDRLTPEARAWADRVEAWLRAHRRFDRHAVGNWRYARHVAACDFDAVEPAAQGAADAVALVYVERTVRAAARVLEDFDEKLELANERGVGLTVAYETDAKIPRSRRQAAAEATEGADVVRLAVYRERRPDGAA